MLCETALIIDDDYEVVIPVHFFASTSERYVVMLCSPGINDLPDFSGESSESLKEALVNLVKSWVNHPLVVENVDLNKLIALEKYADAL